MLEKKQLSFDIDSRETVRCSIKNKTRFIKWFINNKLLEANSTSGTRIRVEENVKLSIDKVQLSDGGTYECRELEYAKYYIVYVNGRFNNFHLAKHHTYNNAVVSLPLIKILKAT